MKVGLSGNIGSGKSTVAKLFETIGIPVFYADIEAKEAYYNSEIKSKIISLLGKEAYLSDTQINKVFIAEKIFQDSTLLKGINQIIHPFVHKQWHHFVDKHHDKPYVIMEAAILHEGGSYKNFDNIILVTAPEELRIERVMQREKCSKEEVIKRIAKQWPEEKKKALSDYCIINDQNHSLIQQVIDIHQKLG